MNVDIKNEWLEALESEEYLQGYAVLRNADTYCCLGVLCDIAVKHGEAQWIETGGIWYVVRPGEDPYNSDDVGASLPPGFIAQWAGLDSPNPITTVVGEDENKSLAGLNDSRAFNFHEIADVIREQL